MKSKRKAIVCDLDKPDERELWEWLQKLPHGEFSEATKFYWKKRIEIEKEENSPEAIWRKEMNDAVTRIEIPWLAELDKMKEEKNDKDN